MIKPYLDAANVDLKSFNDANYQKSAGRLQPVLDTISLMRRMNIWVEITTLVMPGFNDSTDELKDIAGFLSGVGRKSPGISRAFARTIKLRIKPHASGQTQRSLHYRQGRRPALCLHWKCPGRRKTYCHKCGQDLIARRI